MGRAFRPTCLLPLLALAACGANSLTDKLAGPDRVRGDAEGVRIFQAGSRADALPLAIGHCARFSRSAQFERRGDDGAYVFRCVPG